MTETRSKLIECITLDAVTYYAKNGKEKEFDSLLNQIVGDEQEIKRHKEGKAEHLLLLKAFSRVQDKKATNEAWQVTIMKAAIAFYKQKTGKNLIKAAVIFAYLSLLYTKKSSTKREEEAVRFFVEKNEFPLFENAFLLACMRKLKPFQYAINQAIVKLEQNRSATDEAEALFAEIKQLMLDPSVDRSYFNAALPGPFCTDDIDHFIIPEIIARQAINFVKEYASVLVKVFDAYPGIQRLVNKVAGADLDVMAKEVARLSNSDPVLRPTVVPKHVSMGPSIINHHSLVMTWAKPVKAEVKKTAPTIKILPGYFN